MSQALKDLYSPALIQTLADEMQIHYAQFDKIGFQNAILMPQNNQHPEGHKAWLNLSLKQRASHITQQLKAFLPHDYAQALHCIIEVAPKFEGMEFYFFPEFVAMFGLEEDFELNMLALGYLTEFSTAEFAVRPFIEQDPARMLAQAMLWAKSDNEHQRRLASEGFRPRLPWASQLKLFKENPRMLLPVLEMLKTDESLYVRKSVANCLNDISKDHPDLVKDLTQKWQRLPKRKKDASVNPNTQWILKHANRTLLKRSDDMALKLFGFDEHEHLKIRAFKAEKQVVIGDFMHFEFSLGSKQALGKLRVEFEITFVKARGKTSSKRFFISESEETGRKKSFQKRFELAQRTTRKLYPGHHSLSILVNGQVLKTHAFILTESP